MALVLDTGVLYAALDRSDPDHESCRDLIADAQEELVVPAAVLVELDYWVRKFADPSAWLAFAEDVHGRAYTVFPLDATILLRSAQLQNRYADLPLGLVDASVICTCEALGEGKVATLDRRHFTVVMTEGGRSLDILPA